MPQVSAGLLMYRIRDGMLQVLLAHPGGPYFRRKDQGVWTIPKGQPNPEEELLAAAQREFREETGCVAEPPFIPLTPIRQRGGKLVHAWAFAGDCDPALHVSIEFTMDWPPGSGRQASFPEVDRIEFFLLTTAREKINPAQIGLLDELERIVRQQRNE